MKEGDRVRRTVSYDRREGVVSRLYAIDAGLGIMTMAQVLFGGRKRPQASWTQHLEVVLRERSAT